METKDYLFNMKAKVRKTSRQAWTSDVRLVREEITTSSFKRLKEKMESIKNSKTN